MARSRYFRPCDRPSSHLPLLSEKVNHLRFVSLWICVLHLLRVVWIILKLWQFGFLGDICEHMMDTVRLANVEGLRPFRPSARSTSSPWMMIVKEAVFLGFWESFGLRTWSHGDFSMFFKSHERVQQIRRKQNLRVLVCWSAAFLRSSSTFHLLVLHLSF